MKARVAVLKTKPATVIDDYQRLMHLADYQQFLPRDHETALKINISWHYFYPACSTTPWQLDGVIATLLADGYSKEKLYGCHNRTVVVSARRGEIANKQKQVVVDKYGLRNIHLYEKDEEWVQYTPKAKMRVLDKILSGRHPDSQTAGGVKCHPSPHHEDSRVHPNYGRHEERLRRPAV